MGSRSRRGRGRGVRGRAATPASRAPHAGSVSGGCGRALSLGRPARRSTARRSATAGRGGGHRRAPTAHRSCP
eukprot:gene1638-biopygen12380